LFLRHFQIPHQRFRNYLPALSAARVRARLASSLTSAFL
jgi:hypothetical protein